MKTHDPENERIKRQYFIYLKEAMRQSEASLDAVAKALNRFEVYTKYRNFKAFHFHQAVAFKNHLAEQKGQLSGKRLSKATLNTTMSHLKRFFHWLAGQPGYKSRLQYSDAEYFNLSEKDARVASARRDKPVPTLVQIKHVLDTMPAEADLERRNRALIAFTLLTGARDSAIASMKLKHINIEVGSVFQDAREVRTKYSKTFTTYFFPVDEEIRCLFADWVTFLREEKLWGDDDPLFPATKVIVGESRQFEASGLERKHWKSASAIRKIFRDAFRSADLPYYNPHSFRNTLVRMGESICQTPEDFKAWSQNLGHEGVLTTFNSYGNVPDRRQGEIIHHLGSRPKLKSVSPEEIARAVARELRNTT